MALSIPSEAQQEFKNQLDLILNETFLGGRFHHILKQHKALFAGGMALSILLKSEVSRTCRRRNRQERPVFNSRDFDIYVPAKNIKEFLSDIKPFMHRTNYSHMDVPPPYDQSFMRKNSIQARLHYNMNMKNYGCNYQFDVMIVKPSDPAQQDTFPEVENVVRNFDLTCCEVWWDGEKAYASNYADTINNKATLRKEYVLALYQHFNRFLINRLTKYTSRNFVISIDPEFRTGTLEYKKNSFSKEKTVSNPDEWFAKVILRCFGRARDFLVPELLSQGKDPFDPRTLARALKENFYQIPNYEYCVEGVMDTFENMLMYATNQASSQATRDLCQRLYDTMQKYLVDPNFLAIKHEMYQKALRHTGIVPTPLRSIQKTKPTKYFDIIGFEEIEASNIDAFLKENPTYKVFIPANQNEYSIVINTEDIQELASSVEDNWTFECKTDADGQLIRPHQFEKTEAYVGIPMYSGKVYFLVSELLSMLKETHQMFALEGTPHYFTYTASGKNALSCFNPNYVSADHCQPGSAKVVYELMKAEISGGRGGSKSVKPRSKKR